MCRSTSISGRPPGAAQLGSPRGRAGARPARGRSLQLVGDVAPHVARRRATRLLLSTLAVRPLRLLAVGSHQAVVGGEVALHQLRRLRAGSPCARRGARRRSPRSAAPRASRAGARWARGRSRRSARASGAAPRWTCSARTARARARSRAPPCSAVPRSCAPRRSAAPAMADAVAGRDVAAAGTSSTSPTAITAGAPPSVPSSRLSRAARAPRAAPGARPAPAPASATAPGPARGARAARARSPRART